MSISKRGGVYWFEFVYGGERIRRSTGVKNQRAARDIESAFRTALAKGEVGITDRKAAPNFRDAVDGFLAWSKLEHKAHPATYRRYHTSSLALLRHFGKGPLDKVAPEDVERFKAARAGESKTVRSTKGRVSTGKTIKPATVNRELACLKAVFNFWIKADRVSKNPVSRVKPLAENNQQTRVLTHKEQHAYMANATPTLRDIATLILETGMRPEEVYTLRPECVNLIEGTLQVPKGKTPSARRRLQLTKAAREVLQRRIQSLEYPYIFPCESDRSRPIPKINNAHDRAVRDSKIAPARLYDFRHTWATRAAMCGIDLVTLASMLGHSKINMVMRYAHPTQDHQAQAMRQLETFNAHQQIAEFEREGAPIQ